MIKKGHLKEIINRFYDKLYQFHEDSLNLATTISNITVNGAYYLNKSTNLSSQLGFKGDIYDATIGGFPEFFLALEGQRVGDFVFDKKFGIKNESYRNMISGTLIMGFALLDETFGFITQTTDLNDVIRYGAGFLFGKYYTQHKEEINEVYGNYELLKLKNNNSF